MPCWCRSVVWLHATSVSVIVAHDTQNTGHLYHGLSLQYSSSGGRQVAAAAWPGLPQPLCVCMSRCHHVTVKSPGARHRVPCGDGSMWESGESSTAQLLLMMMRRHTSGWTTIRAHHGGACCSQAGHGQGQGTNCSQGSHASKANTPGVFACWDRAFRRCQWLGRCSACRLKHTGLGRRHVRLNAKKRSMAPFTHARVSIAVQKSYTGTATARCNGAAETLAALAHVYSGVHALPTCRFAATHAAGCHSIRTLQLS